MLYASTGQGSNTPVQAINISYYVLESRNRVFKVRDIYEIAAERAGIQWQTIERAIRISMKRAANENTKKLTNKELIARIVDQLID